MYQLIEVIVTKSRRMISLLTKISDKFLQLSALKGFTEGNST
jgi:hypothetical protein